MRSTASAPLTVARQWAATQTMLYYRRQPLVSGDSRRGRVLFQIGDCAAIRRAACRRPTRTSAFAQRLSGETPAKAAFERGDTFMRTVQAYTPAERRSFGTVRSHDGRADFGQTPCLELCRLHHRRREPPPGRPGHSRLRSLRDCLKPGVTIRLPNWRRSPKAWRISMLA